MFLFNQASKRDIFHHLVSCDDFFVPALSSKVDIESYSKKLFENAKRVEFWDNGELSGLVALYCNDHKSKVAYISSVSLLPRFQGKGIAKQLVRTSIQYSTKAGMKLIRLEVDKGNKKANDL